MATIAKHRRQHCGDIFTQDFNHLGDQVGTISSPIDPKLGPLQDNGGTTFTAALLSGSPAIDKANSSGVPTDQRGAPRPIDQPAVPNATGGNGADIGAHENGFFTVLNTNDSGPGQNHESLNREL